MGGAKKNKNNTNRLKRVLLYLLLGISTIFIFFRACLLFTESYEERVHPQINRAVVQVASLLPQFEENEEALRDTYERLKESREQILKSGESDLTGQFETSDSELEDILHKTLSWTERVTKLKIGRDGYVFVALSETGEIIAHPQEEYVSSKLAVLSDLTEESIPILPKKDDVISIEDIDPSANPESMDIPLVLIGPELASLKENSNGDVSEWFRVFSYGSILSYKDTYIICGIPLEELLSYVIWNALFITVIYLIAGWCLVRYCCLKLDEKVREQIGLFERKKSLRQRLLVCTLVVSVALCVCFPCIFVPFPI